MEVHIIALLHPQIFEHKLAIGAYSTSHIVMPTLQIVYQLSVYNLYPSQESLHQSREFTFVLAFVDSELTCVRLHPKTCMLCPTEGDGTKVPWEPPETCRW